MMSVMLATTFWQEMVIEVAGGAVGGLVGVAGGLGFILLERRATQRSRVSIALATLVVTIEAASEAALNLVGSLDVNKSAVGDARVPDERIREERRVARERGAEVIDALRDLRFDLPERWRRSAVEAAFSAKRLFEPFTDAERASEPGRAEKSYAALHELATRMRTELLPK
jgi:hypothetical protein